MKDKWRTFLTWEFALFAIVTGIAIVGSIWYVETESVGEDSAFVAGIFVAVVLLMLSNKMNDRAKARVDDT